MRASTKTKSLKETYRLLEAMYGNHWRSECDRGDDPNWIDFLINLTGDRCGAIRCGYWSETRCEGSVWELYR